MFDEIIKTLILGSSNFEELPKSIFDELSDLGYHINPEKDKTEQLIEALAIYAPIVKTSPTSLKLTEKDLPQKHPDETLECCSEKAAQLFVKVKAKEEFLLKQEFINLLIDNMWRMSEELLPDLMDIGVKQKEFRTSISKIVGERGKWLVSFNPEWNYILENELAVNFEFMLASRRERIIYFRQLRKDHKSQATELLTRIWKDEDAESKLEFLKCLDISPGNHDINFLQLALKDTRKEIRTEAIGLLMKIPESPLLFAFYDFLDKIVEFETSSDKLKIKLDEKNLEIKLKEIGLGDKLVANNDVKEAKFLAQLISFVPLNYWTEHRKIDFKTLLELAFQHQFRDACFWGFAKSLDTFPDLELTTILQRFLFKKPENLNFSFDLKVFVSGPYDDLFNKISLAYFNREQNLKHPMLQVLLLKLRQWSDELSVKICSNLLQMAEQNVLFDKYWVDLLYFASYNMNPVLIRPFYDQWNESSPSAWDRQLKLFFEVLELRNEIKNLRLN